MTHPNLHRVSGTLPPLFDVVLPGIDVEVSDGVVRPNRGGVSVFASKDPTWSAEKTFVLPSTVALPEDLTAHHDRGTHWLLRPSREMTIEEYKTALSQLQGTHAIRNDGPTDISPPLDLPIASKNGQREVRFLYEALMTVSRKRLAVEWDDNAYSYVRLLAASLENGGLAFKSVIWNSDVGWTREAAYVAYATHAYMVWLQEEAVNDDESEADAMNDCAFLSALLLLHVPGNPFSHLAV